MVTLETAYTEADVRGCISRLEEALNAHKTALSGQKERLGRLEAAAGQERDRFAGLQEEAALLSQELSGVKRQLAAAYREDDALVSGLAAGLADAERQAGQEDRRLEQAIDQARLEFDENSRRRQEAGQEADRLSREQDSLNARAAQISDDHQAALEQLGLRLQQAEQQAAANIEQALARYETARIEHEAADSRLHLARTSLQDIETRLTETAAQLTEREAALAQLEAERDEVLSAAEAQYETALAGLRDRRAAQEEELQGRQEDFRRVQSLAELSASALADAGSRLDGLSEELHALYAAAEEETAGASQRMSDAIRQVLDRREEHNIILAQAEQLEEEYTAARSDRADMKEKLLLLQTENQDLSSAAAVAGDLAQEARTACGQAGPELLPTLREMAEALAASAEEARSQSRAKDAELREAEAEMARREQRLEQLQDAHDQVRQELDQAESSCLAAENSMLQLSGQVGRLVSGRSENFDRIKDVRAAYEDAGRELRSLQKAAASAAADLRQSQLEESRLRQSLLQLEQQTAQTESERQRRLDQLTGGFRLRLAEASSLLSLSQDKQDRLLLSQTQKQAELEQAAALQEEAGRREEELQAELAACRSREKDIADELRAQIARQKDEGGQALRLARRDTDETAAQRRGVEDEIAAFTAAQERAGERLAALEEARARVQTDLERRTCELQAACTEQRAAAAARCREIELKAAQAGADCDLAQANADFSRRRAAAAQAGAAASAAAMDDLSRRIDEDTARLIQLRHEEARLRAEAEAEARRRQEEEEAARRRKEEEARVQAEANARRLAELEEAAHAAAQAEQERLAREKADRISRFEDEAARMAAGHRLEREELLELVEKGELQDRLQLVRAQAEADAKAGDFLRITDEEIETLRRDSEFYDQQAAEAAQSFASGRAVLTSLGESRMRLENRRRLMAPLLAAAMSRLDRSEQERDSIRAARSRLQATAAAGEVSQALDEAGAGLEKALEANRRQAAVLEADLAGLQQETANLEQQLAETGGKYDEAAAVIEEVTARWLYKEYAAAFAHAKLDEIERTAEEREAWRRRQEEAALRAPARSRNKTYRVPLLRRRRG